MRTGAFFAIIVSVILIIVGIGGYEYIHEQPINQYYQFELSVTNASELGNFSIGNFHYDIHAQYFNTSLLGYKNWSISFKDYFIGPLAWENQTLHEYLKSDTQLSVNALNITSYIPIQISTTLTNASLTYQQEIVHPTNNHSRYFYSNGTSIYAWIQDNNTTWLRLSGEINRTVYLCSYSTFQLSNDSYMGEAPQLSPTYAEWDNGADVFSLYQNFAGTTVPNGWVDAYPSIVNISNGLTFWANSTVSNNVASIYAWYNMSIGQTFDFYGYDTYNGNNTYNAGASALWFALGGYGRIGGTGQYGAPSYTPNGILNTTGFYSVYLYNSTAFINKNWITNTTQTYQSTHFTQPEVGSFVQNGSMAKLFVQYLDVRNSPFAYLIPSYSFGSSVSY